MWQATGTEDAYRETGSYVHMRLETGNGALNGKYQGSSQSLGYLENLQGPE